MCWTIMCVCVCVCVCVGGGGGGGMYALQYVRCKIVFKEHFINTFCIAIIDLQYLN